MAWVLTRRVVQGRVQVRRAGDDDNMTSVHKPFTEAVRVVLAGDGRERGGAPRRQRRRRARRHEALASASAKVSRWRRITDFPNFETQ